MRNPARGWRSNRHTVPQRPMVAAGGAVASSPPPWIAAAYQQPVRIGLGIGSLILYLWTIHSYRLPIGDVAVLGGILGMLAMGRPVVVPVHLRFFGAFIVWAAFGLAVTESNALTVDILVTLLKMWAIAFVLANLVRTAAELRLVAIIWLGLYALYPVRGALYNQFVCNCTTFGRVAWNFVFANPNDLATLTLIPLGFAAAVALVERVRIWRVVSVIGVGVLALVIMLTQSRGAMLAVGVAACHLVVASRRRGRDLLMLVALMGAAAIAAPKGVWERLAGLSKVSVADGMRGVDEEGSAQARWRVWQIAFRTIERNPAIGVGLGMMPIVHARESARGLEAGSVQGERDTHSTYLRLAAETGIPGLLIYLAMYGSLLWYVHTIRKKIWPIRPRDSQVLLFLELAVVAFGVASIFGTYTFMVFTHISFMFVWVTASILEREPWYVPASATRSPAGVPLPRRGG